MSEIVISNFSERIERYLAEKRALGYSYDEPEHGLHRFSRWCVTNHPQANFLTREIGLDWATKNDHESHTTFVRRVRAVRGFARYLQNHGVQAFVIPTDYAKERKRYPKYHIFTDIELRLIFQEADRMPKHHSDPTGHIIAPVLLRLMYSCGLRPLEARMILRVDMSLETGIMKIPSAKQHKERIVVIDPHMLELCVRYDRVMRILEPQSAYFFPSCTYAASPTRSSVFVRRVVARCMKNAGIVPTEGNKPKVYDFRHTFATKSLHRWLKEGRDLNNCLPYLSAYMGHTRFEETAYYIHLVPEHFPQISGEIASRFACLIPEVCE